MQPSRLAQKCHIYNGHQTRCSPDTMFDYRKQLRRSFFAQLRLKRTASNKLQARKTKQKKGDLVRLTSACRCSTGGLRGVGAVEALLGNLDDVLLPASGSGGSLDPTGALTIIKARLLSPLPPCWSLSPHQLLETFPPFSSPHFAAP